MKDLLNNLQQQVDLVKGQRIVAPFYPDRNIQVRIAGAVLELKPVRNTKNGLKRIRGFPFVGVWEILDDEYALYEELATREQLEAYFDLLPALRVIGIKMIDDKPDVALAIQSRPGKINIKGIFTVYMHLTSSVPTPLFELHATFDGHSVWLGYETSKTAIEEKAIQSYCKYLDNMFEPGTFSVPGTWPGLNEAYALAYTYKLESEKSREQRHIEQALNHAGSKLLEYSVKDGERYEVTFDVAGYRKTIQIDKNMNVLTAGICLVDQHGEHYKGHEMYDLTSFVGVMRDFIDKERGDYD